ncbi:MAG: N-acetylmuramoyl-L-alanine amidase [Clostridia bacterium]|nr:N-acetylmuramoyl-L-alanine amidase [Clostridia bacterium]
MSRKNSLFLLLFILVSVLAAAAAVHRSAPAFSGAKQFAVVLDAGHGAPDGGAVGATGIEEKDINLDIVLKLREILLSRGVRVILTRDGDNGIYDSSAKTIREKKLSDMQSRRDMINGSGADLVVSVHINSFTGSSARGLHVFYDKAHPEAETTASAIQDSIAALTDAKTHAVKPAADNLYLMQGSAVPMILVECGFLSNPEEEQLLLSEQYRAKIAFAIANAISKQDTIK